MLEDLLPSVVTWVRATPPMWEAPLLPEEQVYVERVVEKRRREFTAGRTCAREALRQLRAESTPLLRDDSRRPIWPEGYVGSITHCRDFCAAAVARIADCQGVGLDVEKAQGLEEGVRRKICTDREQRRFSQLPRLPGGAWETLTFSAKESLYKCYSPIYDTFLEFHDVEVDFHPDAREFRVRCLREVPGRERFSEFCGRYSWEEGYLGTSVLLMASSEESQS